MKAIALPLSAVGFHPAASFANFFALLHRAELFFANLMRPPERSAADDTALMLAIGHGDEDAFVAIYDRFSGPLYSLLYKMLQSKPDAEEVLQTVFLQVWNKAGAFEAGRCSVFTWLVVVTRSKAIDRMRQRQRHSRKLEEATVEAEGRGLFADEDHDNVEHHENQGFVREALNGIPVEQRQAIEMAFFRGMSQTEISEALAEPLGTIKARIRRGMLRLRDALACRV